MSERAKRFEARQRALGLTQVTLWVPIAERDDLRGIAKKWRERHIGRVKASKNSRAQPE